MNKAVNDAFAKAKVLAEAGGIKLGEIVNIDYEWAVVRLESNYYKLMDFHESYSLSEDSLDFQPDDIEGSDNVTVVWKIE